MDGVVSLCRGPGGARQLRELLALRAGMERERQAHEQERDRRTQVADKAIANMTEEAREALLKRARDWIADNLPLARRAKARELPLDDFRVLAQARDMVLSGV